MGEAQQALSEASVELEAEVAEASADARAEAQQEVSAAWMLQRQHLGLKLKQPP